MSDDTSRRTCPDCDDPVPFTFHSTSGVGAYKRGDNFNTVPDTAHYICFSCSKTWKQRLNGPLTPDIVGELAFFTCGDHSCGAAMAVTQESVDPAGVELTCAQGHRYRVAAFDGGLTLEAIG